MESARGKYHFDIRPLSMCRILRQQADMVCFFVKSDGENRPAFLLAVVPGLVGPEF
jgi:hypothetical protein